jgi:hypothetical protein
MMQSPVPPSKLLFENTYVVPPALTATPKGPGTEASVPTQYAPGGQITVLPPTQR